MRRKIVCHYRSISSSLGRSGLEVGNIWKWCRKVVVRGVVCDVSEVVSAIVDVLFALRRQSARAG